MKFFMITLVALIALATAQEDRYTNKFDSIDLDETLKSDRLFKNYYKCLLDEGRCTPEGNELKRVLPDALETNCSKCSEKQRGAAIRSIKYLTENRPAEWKALLAKFDPENKYLERYVTEAEKEGIKL